MIHGLPQRRFLPLFLAIGVLLALIPAAAGGAPPAEVPDPMERGPYTPQTVDPFKAGLHTHQEPHGGGNAPGSGGNSAITLQVRGSAYLPQGYEGKSPIIVLVHGNHGSCDSGGGSAPNCTIFKRNDAGYAYLGENLASWGYAVFSLDQDQLMSRQDNLGKGMHARRLLITNLLDALYVANESGLPVSEDANLGDSLIGKLDFTRIGLMGHSRGGDAVSSFIDWNRMRPEGRRYPLRGVISLAPVDYERHAPYGTPFMAVLPWCDGDVSNLQGARLYERSQQVSDDPYPTIQSSQLGANHNWYNTVWFADPQDGNSGSDQACRDTQPNHSRLSGQAGTGPGESYVIDNTDKLNPLVNTRISGDPARMGDQEKIGLATMSAFFRRYVGGEGAFEPYMTGELNEIGEPQIPTSACPTSPGGMRMPCIERVSNSYFAPPEERLDVIVPDTESPLGKNSLGGVLSASGFANPYLEGGGVTPVPPTTPGGADWCNPEPLHTEPGQLGLDGFPAAVKPCPLPDAFGLGGQNDVREDGPVNQSYGRQLALAWDDPVGTGGEPATLRTAIPAALGDVTEFKTLAMGADVNFFDPRNPAREDGVPETLDEALWNPAATTQDFSIVLVDAEGNEAAVSAAAQRYGNALHQTPGSTTARVHVILDQIRVPLEDFAEQGVDLSALRGLELRFGEAGMPQSGSIQLADVRFQESAEGTDVLVDGYELDAGPGEGPPASGPDPAAELEEFDRSPGALRLPDVTTTPGASVWTVDDDGAECPNAQYATIQAAVDQAAPWDTIVICDGAYEEHSTPAHDVNSPVQEGASNGLTITKPLVIKGAGADKVTIRPAAPLAGTAPYLRDGGGNVVTVSRQSLGSTDDPEMFVDISGVTIESPAIYAEAGLAFFNTAGRISDSVVGPLKRASGATELAEKPHGWGIVVTNHLEGASDGTVLRRVTVEETLVHGYQSGGILFDEAKGPDAHEDNTLPAGVKIEGYVKDTIVTGSGPSSLIPQTGIQYHAGAVGFIADSSVSGNVFPTNQRRSVGVLLTGADTDGWYAEGSAVAGNGYGLFNADIANTAIREGAPALATGNYWGPAGPPVEGPSLLGLGIEGISGPDALSAPSVLFDPALGEEPEVAGPSAVTDTAPAAAIVDPLDGTELEIGEAVAPTVLADDDFGVAAVTLTADGTPVATLTESPYAFEWAPAEELGGETVTLEATVLDSSGQATTVSVEVEVAAAEEPPVDPPVDPEPPVKPDPPSEPAPPVAESPAPTAPTAVAVAISGKPVKDTARGTATLTLDLLGPGTLVMSGVGVRKTTAQAGEPGSVQLTIKPKGRKLHTLNRRGKVTVKVRLVFTPSGGTPTTVVRTLVLTKRQ